MTDKGICTEIWLLRSARLRLVAAGVKIQGRAVAMQKRTIQSFSRLLLTAMVAVIGGCATQMPGTQESVKASRSQYKLYFLGGQSNMEGYGAVEELPAAWRDPIDGVMIYTGKSVADNEPEGGIGIWDVLRPGYGFGFNTDGKVNYFRYSIGPELAFGRRLTELDPGSKIAIIKYSRGGSSLQDGASGYGSWAPDSNVGNGVNQYDNALAAIRNALSQRDIDGDGTADHLVPAGIIWMQGEADAHHSQVAADAYEGNLKRMMNLLRVALGVDDVPVVIGKITDSGRYTGRTLMPFISTVHAAQRNFVRDDTCAAYVTITDGFKYRKDGWHYLTGEYLRLGTAFAEAVATLSSKCASTPASSLQ